MTRLLTQAALDVLAERQRQQEGEGILPEHDDQHLGGELAYAAAAYTLESVPDNDSRAQTFIRLLWPWHSQWWKPSTRRRTLVKAGALILAEIERLDRAEGRAQ